MLKLCCFEDLTPGDSATLQARCTDETIAGFAQSTGDNNPVHLDDEAAKAAGFPGRIAHGLWTGGLVSAVIGTQLPGPGTVYLSQNLRFLRPVRPGDELTVRVTVTAKHEEKHHIELACEVLNQKNKRVLEGEALVMVPSRKGKD